MGRTIDLIKTTGILAFGRICTQLISFFLLPLYTAVLIPSEYGTFDLLNTAVSLLIPIVGWQCDQGAFRYLLDCRKSTSSQKTVISTLVLISAAQCILFLGFAAVVLGFFWTPYWPFLTISLVTNVYLALFLQIARGLGHNDVYAVGSFISGVLTVALNVLFLVIIPMGIWGLMFALILAQLVTVVYLIISLKLWSFFSVFSWNFDVAKRILAYSLPLVPNSLCWWVINMAGRVIISMSLGSAQNGVYSVASKFSSAFISAYNVFNLSWSESVSLHSKDDDADEFFSDVVSNAFCVFSFLCSLATLLVCFAFDIMVDAAYGEAYYQIPILMVGALAQVYVGLLSALYIALKRTKEIAKTSAYAAAMSILITMLLIKPFGAYAASIATLVSFGTMSLYRTLDVRKRIRFSPSKAKLAASLLMVLVAIAAYCSKSQIVCVIGLMTVLVLECAVNKAVISSSIKAICRRSSK